ncbi:MAG: NUDIX domain-containing protein [Candidatus Sungbacteria bacterium]|nr:NUDIX domain-containing protein [Candidatus Sungbacteria bacterium]
MNTTILIIGVVKKSNQVLLRKKPPGVGPYKEPWYLFGGKIELEKEAPEEVIQRTIKEQAGIDVKMTQRLGWDTEVKPSEQEVETFYIYLDTLCEYISGELKPGPGIFHLEWVDIEKLGEYELNPPTNKLFRRVGYLKD